MRLSLNTNTARPEYDAEPLPIAQVFVFKDETCLGWDCFYKDTIRIGRDPGMDIRLNDAAIAEKHAEVYIKGDKIVVSATTHELELWVNDQIVTSAILNTLDYITIGPYTLKVKLPQIRSKLQPKEKPKIVPCLSPRPNVIEKWRKHADQREPTNVKEKDNATAKDAFTNEPSSSPKQKRRIDTELDEDDEFEEEETIQPFLQAELLETSHALGLGRNTNHVLEIIKCKGEAVVDFKCIGPKEKYDIHTGTKRFRLAAYKSIESCHVYFSSSHAGHTKQPGATARCLADLCTRKNLHRKKKKIYTIRLVAGQTFSIGDGDYHYQLRLIPRSESPKVSVTAKSTRPLFKNLIKSSVIHVVFMLLASIILSSPELPDPMDTEARFVKIDTSQLQKSEPTVQKPEPAQPLKKVIKPKTKVPAKPPKTTRTAQKKPPKSPPKKQLNSSPNVGGGNDVNGNVKTRNIKQAGLLGLIGDSIGLAPKEALASVTNLDVVSLPGVTDKNFNIGGIPGKLPGSKLEIVAGDVVRSKGTQQVLKSAGIQGDGEVAALKKGQTGQNKVMAMVSVELNKSVRVQGGMSRQAVKRVIDQHLDEISYCYENALIGAPSLMGNIVFEWKILMSGKVGMVRIKSSTIRSGQIHQCIQAAIKSWQFEKPQHSEVIVSYPFVFDIVGF